VEDSEELEDVRSAQTVWKNLTEHELAGLRVGLTWGSQPSAEKEEVLRAFSAGEMQVLVSTTVIEVGVNVPNATVMMIQNAERFGLSQLHQLRGRVGRGGDQSYCILLTDNEISSDTRKRMNIMVETNDGFRIAEADLQLRGPGDMQGTLQSGTPFELHIANLATDGQLVAVAREAALAILDQDPLLEDEMNRIYKRRLDTLRIEAHNWSDIS
jgi:ATP-dependent DNA helicase RecG